MEGPLPWLSHEGRRSDAYLQFPVSAVGWTRSVVLKLGSPDVLGLQLPEILASTASGEGFWELQSIGDPNV